VEQWSNGAMEQWSNGETIRDYLHIDDVVFGLPPTLRAQPVKTSYIFNLGSGRELFVNALISQPSLLARRRTKVINDHARKFDIPFEALKISSARAEQGWYPQVDLSEGPSRTFGLLPMYF
jgi:UDP-glucose 4-epimerase